jgi:uncharacterized surface protein with fasciclin (FAS1) repeats
MAEDEVVDAFGGRLAEDVDRPDEESVLLAPIRDFTPGGTSPGDGKDADIESPFATGPRPTSDKVQSWLLDPFGKGSKKQPRSVSSWEPAADEEHRVGDEEGHLDKVASFPKPIEPPVRFERFLRFDRPDSEPDNRPEAPPTTPIVRSPPENLPGRMRLVVPRDLQKLDPEPTPFEPEDDTSIDGIPSEEDVISPSRDLDEVIEAPLHTDMPAVEPQPSAEKGPSQLKTGLAAARQGIRGAATWLSAAWMVYSRHCGALEHRLSHLGRQVGSQGLQIALAAGSTLTEKGAQASTAMVRSTRQGAAAMKPWIEASARSAIAVGKSTGQQVRVGSTKVSEAARDRVAAWKRAKVKTDRLPQNEPQADDQDAKARAAALVERLHAAMKPRPSADDIEGQKSVPESSLATAPSADEGRSVDEEPAEEPSTPSDQREVAWFGPRLQFGLAAASFGVASILFFFAALSSVYTHWPARAELVAKLPERGGTLARSVALPSDQPSDGVVRGASLTGALPPILEEGEPLSEIVAYIDRRSRTYGGGAVAPEVAPLLLLAEETDGLQQFVNVAKIVGLDQLLEPDQDYTILAPSDAAFEKLGAEEWKQLLDPSGHERLLTLLANHVFHERVTIDDLRTNPNARPSMAKASVSIDAGTIVDADLQARNGILHVIDDVLVPLSP